MTEQIQNVPLDAIDSPKVAMRTDVHDDQIQELADSIRSIGLLQPILVRPVGERYEIIAGHRRVIAARVAGEETILAIIRTPSEEEATVFKLHENLLRRDVNPVDEAIFLATIVKEENYDVKKIAKLTRRSEAYISSRLELLEYPDYLIEAIGEKEITLGAASWLNKITNERVRKNYVRYGISGGISVKRAIAWFESWKVGASYSNPMEIKEKDEATGEEREVHKEQCVICQLHDVPAGMMLYYAHMDCVRKIEVS